MNKTFFGIRSIAILGDWRLSAQILLALTVRGIFLSKSAWIQEIARQPSIQHVDTLSH